MMRAVVLSPRSQGITVKVDRSGMRYMSDSAMRAKPSIDDPSNHLPWLMQSSSCVLGIVTLLTTPSTSVNWRLMKRTFSLRTTSRTSDLFGKNDSLRHFLHRLATVHRQLLDLAEGLRLLQPLAVHEDALCALDQLARLQRLAQVADLLLELAELAEARHGHLDGRHQLALAERLHDVAHDPGRLSALDELRLREGRQQQHRRDALLGEDACRLDAVRTGHLDVHDHQIRPELARQVDGALAVARLAHNQVAEAGQHLLEIHADHRLVVGDDDARLSAQAAASTRLRGNDTRTRTPWPFSSVSWPRRSSFTSVRTICRPRLESRSRSNPAGKPVPSSMISMTVSSADSFRLIWIVPCARSA